MPVILYREQRKQFIAGVEQTGLWQAGQKVWAKPSSLNWVYPVPTDGGPNGVASAFFRGQVTTQGDGSYRVTTIPSNTNGRALVTIPQVAGTPIVIESSLQFNDATRLILRQVESNDSTGGITIWDITRPSVGAVVNRTDSFNMVSNRMFLHFIGVTSTGQYFTINPQTRYRVA